MVQITPIDTPNRLIAGAMGCEIVISLVRLYSGCGNCLFIKQLYPPPKRHLEAEVCSVTHHFSAI